MFNQKNKGAKKPQKKDSPLQHPSPPLPPETQNHVREFLLAMAEWISDLKSQQGPDEYRTFFDRMFNTYIISPGADDRKERSEAVVVFTSLKELVAIMEHFGSDFDALDTWILQQTKEPCTTEAA